MSRIKISHEVPKNLLEISLEFNDYDYLLPYFYFRDEQYREFYSKSRDNGRFIILDNGLFEGETYSDTALIDLINKTLPNIFIVPDAWNEWRTTYTHANQWFHINKQLIPDHVDLMVVLQGQSIEEISVLYDVCHSMGYRHFALNHSSIAYNTIFPHRNKLVSKMMGRIALVEKLSERFEKNDNYVHLLGAALPQEFGYYDDYEFIKSIDTSNPVLAGLAGLSYKNGNLFEKPTEKMEHYFNQRIESNDASRIFDNIESFRKQLK